MPKKFQDIIPPGNRSIRNVPLINRLDREPYPGDPSATSIRTPRGRSGDISKKSSIKPIMAAPVSPTSDPIIPPNKKIEKLLAIENHSRRGKSIWFVAVLCIVVLVFVIVSKFSKVTISLIASSRLITLSDTFKLSQNSSTTDAIDYDVITLSVNAGIPESAIKTSSSTVNVGKRATGTVVITNNFSTSNQILVKNSRLESTDGKIFYLDASVTVPGQKKGSSGTIPGAVIAKITAEKEGDEFNIGIADFTFPGLKTSPRYKYVTAKSKTEIAGGSDTLQKPTLSDESLAEIKRNLKNSAINQIYSQKSNDSVLFEGAMQESLDITSSSSAVLTVSAMLVNKTDLVNQIDRQKNLGLNLSPSVRADLIVSTTSVEMKMPIDIKLSSIDSEESFNILLEGTTTIASDISPETLKRQLAGLNEKTAESNLKSKIGVEGVLVEMWPWWVKSIPLDKNRIIIKIENN